MKSILLTVVSSLLFMCGLGASSLFGQHIWTNQYTGATSSLNDISFADTSNGWAVGFSGTIVHTTDGGASWGSQTAPNGGTLNGVYSVNANECWAVAGNETIIHTSAGGANWEIQHEGSGASSGYLQDILFVNADTGWAVGSDRLVLYTDDGGATWTEQNSSNSGGFEAIAAGDAQNLWAVGDDFDGGSTVGLILHSSDGGNSWQEQDSGLEESLYGVCFVDNTHGWAVGNGGSVIATSDGGATWTQQTSAVDNMLQAVDFLDANIGIAVGVYASQYTMDGGATWSEDDASGQINGIEYVDTNHIWTAGNSGTVLFSSGITTDIQSEDGMTVPARFSLQQNYPNPFNPETTIQYSLPTESDIAITVYNARGQAVQNVIKSGQGAGHHFVKFNGKSLPSGIYFYRIQAADFSQTRKMILLK